MKEDEAITKLLKKEITPNECKCIIGTENLDELEKRAKTTKFGKCKTHNKNIQHICNMDFLEIRDYCKKKVNKGINLNDLAIELDIKWEEGVISGFDYRYFKESIGLEITNEFIKEAKRIGRYGK